MEWVSAVAWTVIGITFALLWGQWQLARLTRGLIERHQSLLADATVMQAALASIAANTCCDQCQEAARVAQRALRVVAKAE
jgi:hypothetical protein